MTRCHRKNIFISYRRNDSRGYALALSEHLSRTLTKINVLIDQDLQVANDFETQIDIWISKTDLFIAIVDRDWARYDLDKGKFSIQEDKDWIRIELRSAKRYGVDIAPVLIDGASMPEKGILPSDIEFFSSLHAISSSTTKHGLELVSKFIQKKFERPFKKVYFASVILVIWMISAFFIYSFQNTPGNQQSINSKLAYSLIDSSVEIEKRYSEVTSRIANLRSSEPEVYQSIFDDMRSLLNYVKVQTSPSGEISNLLIKEEERLRRLKAESRAEPNDRLHEALVEQIEQVRILRDEVNDIYGRTLSYERELNTAYEEIDTLINLNMYNGAHESTINIVQNFERIALLYRKNALSDVGNYEQ